MPIWCDNSHIFSYADWLYNTLVLFYLSRLSFLCTDDFYIFIINILILSLISVQIYLYYANNLTY